MTKVSLILACAGKGTRAGFKENKIFQIINGKTVLENSLAPFLASENINEIIITASRQDFDKIKSLAPRSAKIVIGGTTRTQSIKNALDLVSNEIVLIHDGARCFVTTSLIDDVIDSVKNFGSGIPVLESTNTLAVVENGFISDVLGKDGIYSIQTPQGFLTNEILRAYDKVGDKIYPDDSSIYAKFIKPPHTVKGCAKNVKLTYKEDFKQDIRIGTGFDCHKLVDNRKLILGGIEIPSDKGLLGHSDADVLLHAIMDAILSALSLRDIGYHFSDKDSRYKDISSVVLLEKVLVMMKEKGYKIKNLSAVIMAEKPKLINHIPAITENPASLLDIDSDDVGITATTLEGLGFVGREEGICVKADILLTEI